MCLQAVNQMTTRGEAHVDTLAMAGSRNSGLRESIQVSMTFKPLATSRSEECSAASRGRISLGRAVSCSLSLRPGADYQ